MSRASRCRMMRIFSATYGWPVYSAQICTCAAADTTVQKTMSAISARRIQDRNSSDAEQHQRAEGEAAPRQPLGRGAFEPEGSDRQTRGPEETRPMKGDQPRETARHGAGVETESLQRLEDVVVHTQLERLRARARSGRRGELTQELRGEPDCRRDTQRGEPALPVCPPPPRTVGQLDRDDGKCAVDREFPLEKADPQDQSEPHRTAARQPQQQDVQER